VESVVLYSTVVDYEELNRIEIARINVEAAQVTVAASHHSFFL
jgi:hypothetical protein